LLKLSAPISDLLAARAATILRYILPHLAAQFVQHIGELAKNPLKRIIYCCFWACELELEVNASTIKAGCKNQWVAPNLPDMDSISKLGIFFLTRLTGPPAQSPFCKNLKHLCKYIGQQSIKMLYKTFAYINVLLSTSARVYFGFSDYKKFYKTFVLFDILTKNMNW
jgi:hypothetical protein